MPLKQVLAISGPPRTSLIVEVVRTILQQSVSLGDVAFGQVGDGIEFSAICELPDGLAPEALQEALRALPSLEGSNVAVGIVPLSSTHDPKRRVSHRVDIEGRNYLQMLVQSAYILRGFGADIVRFVSHPVFQGSSIQHYIMRISVDIPDAQMTNCLEALQGAAGLLNMQCNLVTGDAKGL